MCPWLLVLIPGGAAHVLAVLCAISSNTRTDRDWRTSPLRLNRRVRLLTGLSAQVLRNGFAQQGPDGRYHIGFELLRLVIGYRESRVPSLSVAELLKRLADATGGPPIMAS